MKTIKELEPIRQHPFKRVVVLLSDLENTHQLLQKAVDFSQQQQIILEILYVHEEALFEIPDYFLSENQIAHERLDKKRIKAKIQEQLVALGVQEKYAILIYENDTVNQLLYLFKEQKETLFITSYHQELNQKLIEKTPYSFWIIKKSVPQYKRIVLPLDFSENAKKALQITQQLFTKNVITIVHDYRYLLDAVDIQVDYLNLIPTLSPETIAFNNRLKEKQKEKFEKYKKEFTIKGDCIEGKGALDQDLMSYISKRGFDLTILCHQDSELFLSPSLIITLLKEVSTDFFIFNL